MCVGLGATAEVADVSVHAGQSASAQGLETAGRSEAPRVGSSHLVGNEAGEVGVDVLGEKRVVCILFCGFSNSLSLPSLYGRGLHTESSGNLYLAVGCR